MAGFDGALDDLARICVEEFPEDEDFTHVSPSLTRRVKGVFDRNHESVSLLDGAEVSSFHPAIFVRAGDFPGGVEAGDRFVRGKTGETFAVEDVQPDSGSGLFVILHQET